MHHNNFTRWRLTPCLHLMKNRGFIFQPDYLYQPSVLSLQLVLQLVLKKLLRFLLSLFRFTAPTKRERVRSGAARNSRPDPPSRKASNLLLQPCELSVNPPRFHGNQSETCANYVLLFISQTAPRFVWWLNSETVKVMQRGTLSSSCWFTAQCFTATCVCPPTLLNGQGPLQRGARQLRVVVVVVGAIKSRCTLEEPLSE